MIIKSIITQLEKLTFASDIGDTQWITATTIEGNKIIFWGNELSRINLVALEQQQLPIVVHCSQCEKVDTKCISSLEDYFSVPESATVTIYPYKPEIIHQLLEHGYRQNELMERLTHTY